ncbi:MAG TPA: hypothetical protein VIR02_08120 [Anaerolineales bacterium]
MKQVLLALLLLCLAMLACGAPTSRTPGTREYKASLGYRTAAENRMKEVECTSDL